MCCDIDGLFSHIGEMNRIELAKAYLEVLQENANLRRQIQRSSERERVSEEM